MRPALRGASPLGQDRLDGATGQRRAAGAMAAAQGEGSLPGPSLRAHRVLATALPGGDRVLTAHSTELEPLPRLVGQARAFVLAHAPELSEDTRDTLALLTSELVTNAVIHARTEIDLGVTVTENNVVVTVDDLDIGNSELPGDVREGGRGLLLVEALADEYALTRHPDGGKTAWFRLSRNTVR